MTKPEVLILQHAEWEKPGLILSDLEEINLPTQTLNISKEKKPDLPDFSDVSGMVIMGGPMGALDFDKYPGLKAESKLVTRGQSASASRCWACAWDIRSSPPRWARSSRRAARRKSDSRRSNASTSTTSSPCGTRRLDVLHWHNDVVTLPEGATSRWPAARRRRTRRSGSVRRWALQFHLEVTPTLLDEWLDEPCMVKDLKAAGGSKSQLRDAFAEYNPQLQPMADQVFSGFAARCSTYAATLER
jgi:GMP synthase (glutamine-hydrolysing)